MTAAKLRIALFAAAAAVGFSAGLMPASAAGCNGVVNPFIWGCAPWDNNNGPNFPYYKAKKVTVPLNQGQLITRNGVQMFRYKGQDHPVIAVGGGNVIAPGAGNLIGQAGGN